MKPNDIIGYSLVVSEEKVNLQKGMNFGIGKSYSVLLMSVRVGAPYADAIDKATGSLIYEGHNEPRTKGLSDPKSVDQPLVSSNGTWTQNGRFFRAAVDYRSGVRREPELVKVYEKIHRGIWCYKGFFNLVDARITPSAGRKVFKFFLRPVERKTLGRIIELPHTRLIPTDVKISVWNRDRGKCVLCGSNKNLHYDHIIPFSKGGTSLVAENVRLLCVKHNLEKSDKIMTFAPLIVGL